MVSERASKSRRLSTDTQNHKNNNVNNVENGMAPEDPSAHKAIFKTKNIANTHPRERK